MKITLPSELKLILRHAFTSLPSRPGLFTTDSKKMAPKLFSFGTKTKVADADPKPNKLFPLATKGKVADAKPKATPSKK